MQHSGQTISKYIHYVPNAIIAWAPDLICSKECLTQTTRHIKEHLNGKFMPIFKDAIGALDDTHIDCIVAKKSKLAFECGRDPWHTTQNVLGVYDFSMKFMFVFAGWEGITHDCKVLNHAISNPQHNFPHQPRDKYYIVDVGYPNRKGYLTAYQSTRYHVAQFKSSQPKGKEEHFNYIHSSLRNVIERAFGVLKKRWNVLNLMPPYQYPTQVKIVVTCMAIHNFIIEQRQMDELLNQAEIDEAILDSNEETYDEDNDTATLEDIPSRSTRRSSPSQVKRRNLRSSENAITLSQIQARDHRVDWEDGLVSKLLDICIDLAKMGRKPGNHLDAKGYEMLEKRFNECTQVHRTRA